MNQKIILILDLDGVLITSSPWKKDTFDTDGYTLFNSLCVNHLNILLSKYEFDIYLSSTRRSAKTLTEFNDIFRNRGISQGIKGYLPSNSDRLNRGEEVYNFVMENKLEYYIIIDDDKTLNNYHQEFEPHLVLTQYHQGFSLEKLMQAVNLTVNLLS